MRRRLAALIAVRLIVATVLLGSAVVVQLRAPDATSINPFFFLIGLTYVVSLGFIGSLRFVERFPWLTDVHFAIDAMLVSAAVFLTGGVESLFTILYMLPIVAASSMQSRRGGLQVAGLSTILLFGRGAGAVSPRQRLPRRCRGASASTPNCRRCRLRNTWWRSTRSGCSGWRCWAGRSPSASAWVKPNWNRPPRRSPTCRRSINTCWTTWSAVSPPPTPRTNS